MTLKHAFTGFSARLAFLHLLGLLALALALFWQTRPVSLPDLHLADGEKLHCVSYAPYHLPGQTPLDPHMRIPREQIEADLKALAPITECVRIYAVNQGLEHVPDVARSLGLKVLLGAWVGYEPKKNQVELETAIRLANAYPDVVRALVVGNEVMLRREQSEAQMKALIDQARTRVKVPVTYADVWEFWLRHPSLAESVDFLTIHMLPYWEDEPVASEEAVAHVAQVRQRMLDHFGKPVLIGETGWPSQGRQRESARTGRVEQARYIRTFVHQAHAEGWDYNLIEAVDQPWKRNLEGTVGGFWGMLDVNLQPNFPLAGPVSERLSLWPPLMALLGGVLAGLLMTWRSGRLSGALAGGWSGVVLFLAWEHGLVAYRNGFEWGLLGGVALLGTVFVLRMGQQGGRFSLPQALPLVVGQAASQEALVRLALYFAGATAALLLLADPRYRDFPYWLYLLPLPALLALVWSGLSTNGRAETLLGLTILVCGLGRWFMEPLNFQAQAWALLCAGMALTALLRTSKASSTAGAEASTQ